jgi:hypothetical protein
MRWATFDEIHVNDFKLFPERNQIIDDAYRFNAMKNG